MDGTEVSPGELRLLACQADLIPVVLGKDSTALEHGRQPLSPRWVSNPRPSAYKADALPLSYKGADTICRHNLLDGVPCVLADSSAE